MDTLAPAHECWATYNVDRAQIANNQDLGSPAAPDTALWKSKKLQAAVATLSKEVTVRGNCAVIWPVFDVRTGRVLDQRLPGRNDAS